MQNPTIEKMTSKGERLQARNCVIISRHTAVLEWLKSPASGVAELLLWEEEATADPGWGPGTGVVVITGNATVTDCDLKIVIGNVPLSLASAAREVWAIEFGGNPPRGQEYTCEDMILAGAHLACYAVKPLGEGEWSSTSYRGEYRRDLDGPYAGH